MACNSLNTTRVENRTIFEQRHVTISRIIATRESLSMFLNEERTRKLYRVDRVSNDRVKLL